ncbi:MAG: DoxX family protein [Acidimicrobiales bacterium]
MPETAPASRRGGNWLWLAPPPRALFAAGSALLPLRVFLGATFCFAGLRKLTNPAFVSAANPASIQSQLAGAARRSPIHGLIGPLTHVAVLLGILIALAEIAIGLGTLLGLWTRIAAAGGVALSTGLFLTISFHSNPYYTGSDIVFLFAWLPLVLAGAGGVLSVDAVVANLVRHRQGAEPLAVVPIPFSAVRRACGSYDGGRCTARHGAPCEPGPCPYLLQRPTTARRLVEREVDRRTFAAQATVAGIGAVAALLAGGVAAAIGRLVGGSPTIGSSHSLDAATGSGTTTSTVSSTGATTSPHPAGTRSVRPAPRRWGAIGVQRPHRGGGDRAGSHRVGEHRHRRGPRRPVVRDPTGALHRASPRDLALRHGLHDAARSVSYSRLDGPFRATASATTPGPQDYRPSAR